MFRVNLHSPDSWLIGISRFQAELEDDNEYEVLAIGLLLFSIEIVWTRKEKIIA